MLVGPEAVVGRTAEAGPWVLAALEDLAALAGQVTHLALEGDWARAGLAVPLGLAAQPALAALQALGGQLAPVEVPAGWAVGKLLLGAQMALVEVLAEALVAPVAQLV